MRWSKLRALVRERFAESISDKIDIHSAAYGNCSCGHCWITYDKNVIANFCTRAYFNKLMLDEEGSNPKTKNLLVAYGEKSRQDAYSSMFAFIHDLSIDQALSSEDPLVQCLAVLDNRIGRRRLTSLKTNEFHELAQTLLLKRRELEGIATDA